MYKRQRLENLLVTAELVPKEHAHRLTTLQLAHARIIDPLDVNCNIGGDKVPREEARQVNAELASCEKLTGRLHGL